MKDDSKIFIPHFNIPNSGQSKVRMEKKVNLVSAKNVFSLLSILLPILYIKIAVKPLFGSCLFYFSKFSNCSPPNPRRSSNLEIFTKLV